MGSSLFPAGSCANAIKCSFEASHFGILTDWDVNNDFQLNFEADQVKLLNLISGWEFDRRASWEHKTTLGFNRRQLSRSKTAEEILEYQHQLPLLMHTLPRPSFFFYVCFLALILVGCTTAPQATQESVCVSVHVWGERICVYSCILVPICVCVLLGNISSQPE